jgi:protein-arginine deiminase
MSARLSLALLPLPVALAACRPGESDVKTPVEPKPVSDDVYGVPNMDDDDENGSPDWEDDGADNENDFTTLDLTGFGPLTLVLDGAGDVRVWRDGEIVLGPDPGEADVDEGTFQVEFAESMATARLTITPVDSPSAAVTRTLRAAPLLLNHHRLGAERVIAMEATGSQGNEVFTNGFREVLGDDFEAASLRTYGWDVWVQDELEFATFTSPGHRMDVVIDSIRTNNDRYLDELPEEAFQAPDTAVRTWGSGRATSQDSFGNLEVSPPVTVDGVEYPFGRIYWGETGSGGLTDDLADMLEAQRVQDPFQLDIRFLCVGHVDEFSSFVPDATAPKGFRFLYADTNVGRSFLAGLDPSTLLPRYARDHGYNTLGDLVDDSGLWAYNEDIQADYLDPNLEIFKRELGLDEADIIRIPAVFEESRMCGGAGLSLIPGTVNLVVADVGDGTTHVFMPDPFLRADEDDISADPLISEVESLLPAGITPHWVDDWDWYHLQWGEVHCGSNTQRTPGGDWWTLAAHLLEDE